MVAFRHNGRLFIWLLLWMAAALYFGIGAYQGLSLARYCHEDIRVAVMKGRSDTRPEAALRREAQESCALIDQEQQTSWWQWSRNQDGLGMALLLGAMGA